MQGALGSAVPLTRPSAHAPGALYTEVAPHDEGATSCICRRYAEGGGLSTAKGEGRPFATPLPRAIAQPARLEARSSTYPTVNEADPVERAEAEIARPRRVEVKDLPRTIELGGEVREERAFAGRPPGSGQAVQTTNGWAMSMRRLSLKLSLRSRCADLAR